MELITVVDPPAKDKHEIYWVLQSRRIKNTTKVLIFGQVKPKDKISNLKY